MPFQPNVYVAGVIASAQARIPDSLPPLVPGGPPRGVPVPNVGTVETALKEGVKKGRFSPDEVVAVTTFLLDPGSPATMSHAIFIAKRARILLTSVSPIFHVDRAAPALPRVEFDREVQPIPPEEVAAAVLATRVVVDPKSYDKPLQDDFWGNLLAGGAVGGAIGAFTGEVIQELTSAAVVEAIRATAEFLIDQGTLLPEDLPSILFPNPDDITDIGNLP